MSLPFDDHKRYCHEVKKEITKNPLHLHLICVLLVSVPLLEELGVVKKRFHFAFQGLLIIHETVAIGRVILTLFVRSLLFLNLFQYQKCSIWKVSTQEH